MTLFFPDLNVCLALSDTGHIHSTGAWKWMKMLPDDAQFIFCRYTQVGLLRLLTNTSIMGDQTLTKKRHRSCRFAVGTVASKRMDRLVHF
jgi:hypothetical protein